jgi:hypothetical protein
MSTIEITPLPSPIGTNLLNWRFVDRGDQIELASRFPSAFVVFWLVMTGLLLCLGFAIADLGPREDGLVLGFRRGWLVIASAIGLCSPLIGYLSYRSGPRFLIDRLCRTITLPKLKQTWPLNAVVGWQVIDTLTVRRSAEGSGEVHESQLNLVVREKGEIGRYRLTGGEGQGMAMRLKELVDEINALTGLGLVSDVRNGVEQMRSAGQDA